MMTTLRVSLSLARNVVPSFKSQISHHRASETRDTFLPRLPLNQFGFIGGYLFTPRG